MAKRVTKKTDKIFKDAGRYLVGGVDSPVRSFEYAGGRALTIKKGKGARVYDYDGNAYIDYVLSWGANILGHAHPSVIRDLKAAVSSGLSFGATSKPEAELAKIIIAAIPFIEKIRFVNSGTEAVMGAVRLARGYTKRDKILKFENSYHGHADYLLVKSGSGLATLGIPSSSGVPKDFVKHTLIAPMGNARRLDEIFNKYGDEIAAVIVEPVGGNYGVIPPDIDFLKRLRYLTKQSGSILIFDEVITGFRFGFGSEARRLGITPDLICLGKIIGGGLPIGAYGGSEKIMDRLAPKGDVYQASTFSGNPIVMRSGIATLEILKKNKNHYERLKELTGYLASGLEAAARRKGTYLKVSHYGNMFSLRFRDRKRFAKFYKGALEKGIFFAPSEFEANFVSFAHTKKDIDKTIEGAGHAFGH